MRKKVSKYTTTALVFLLLFNMIFYGPYFTTHVSAEEVTTMLLSNDFNDASQLQGWAIKNSNDPGNTATIQDGKLKLSKITTDTNTRNYLTVEKSLSPAYTSGTNNDKLVVEFKVQVNRTDAAAVAFPALIDSSVGKQAFNGQIVPNATGIYYKMHNGSAMSYVTSPTDSTKSFAFTAGQEYTIKHVLDYTTQKHDLYIDGVKVADGYSFFNNVTKSDKIQFIVAGMNVEILLDDLKVYKVSDAVPTPTPTISPTSTPVSYPDFPVYQTTKNKLLGGSVGGFGMLAQYDSPGPKKVLVRRTTAVAAGEPFKPITLARVFDPDGNLVAIHEFTDQQTGSEENILTIPDGKAGIWRVSFSGGRDGDLFEIGLPQTSIWGVRGEMALGVTATTPKDSYIYLPRTTQLLFLEAFGVPTAQIQDLQGNLIGRPTNQNGRFTLTVNNVPTDTVWKVKLDANSTEALSFDGVPGLLCPTEEAARALKGGTVEADGLLVAGPLQARIRHAMVNMKDDDFNVALNFPTEVPSDLENPIAETLNYGKYGGLMSLQSALSRQILDSSSPYYGVIMAIDPNNKPNPKPAPMSWETSLHPSILSPWDALDMAGLVSNPAQLNPAHGNQALLKRTLLSAYYHLVSTQGDDYIREGDMRTNNYPLTHAFFAYYNVAKAFYLIKDMLSPEERELFSEALIAAGDRIGDYKGYQSNQWQHTIAGHLYTYMATGEERFLGYFERMVTSFVDDTHGPGSKYGQNPTGYYREEYGPDGNYGSMNEYVITSIYDDYSLLPNANPILVGKIKNSIEKDLYFQSFYWLPQPSGVANGTFLSPSSMCARTKSLLAVPSYPGLFLAHKDFPLALARYNMIKDPINGAGDAMIFSHLINNDSWAKRLLEWALPLKDTYYQLDNTNGPWVSDLYKIYTAPDTVQPAKLPIEYDKGTWTLPGNVAWKRGPLYGSIFYDIVGNSSIPAQSKVGGGPTVFWSEGTGSVICSTKNNANGVVTGVNDLSFTSIYGYDSNGKFFSTGTERPTFNWIREGEVFEIRAPLTNPQGELVWTYYLGDDETKITVSFKTTNPSTGTFINLPIIMKEPNAVLEGPDNGKVVFKLGQSAMSFSWSDNTNASIGADISTFAGTIKPLRIAIPSDGTPVTIGVKASTPAAAVTLDKTSMYLNSGESEMLTATVTPETAEDKVVTWSSSDTSVATVDENGKVAGVAPGKAVITVKTRSGGYTANCNIIVDSTPPVTTATVNGAAKNNWYSGDVSVTLTSIDDLSGVYKTEYRTGVSGDWITYTGPFTLTQEGTGIVQYRSTDNSGNVEDIKQVEVKIDKTAPVTSAAAEGTKRIDGTYNSDVTLTLTAEDTGSGVEKTEYSMDGTNWLTYGEPIVLVDNGTYTLSFRSVDIAGNVEAIQNTSIIIAKSPDVMTEDLIKQIKGMNLDEGIQNSLTSKLDNVIKSILKGDKNSSMNQLNAFINEVEAQNNKKLTPEQATKLKTTASKIMDSL